MSNGWDKRGTKPVRSCGWCGRDTTNREYCHDRLEGKDAASAYRTLRTLMDRKRLERRREEDDEESSDGF